ncbi:MAG: hypothetical protein J5789_07470 [Oscillospiraceae bacterium]|nr:hypothetical protein [Oscillospiraceae bacterium]
MNRAKRLLLILLGAMMMLHFFGCGKPKHKLLYDGFGFTSDKTAYAAGETVTVYFNMIATDTDYRFWLDDEDVELERDYNDGQGYVFTFSMPDHDLTLHVESHNSMAAQERFPVTFENRVQEADIWILPQTSENLKTTLWGTPTVGKLAPGETAEVVLTESYAAEAWLVRIIDTDQALYSANDLKLADGYRIVFRSEGARFDAVIEVLDPEGSVVFSGEAFSGSLGAE